MNEEINKWLDLTLNRFNLNKPIKLELVKCSRKRRYYKVRFIAMYLMRKHIEDITLEEIGEEFKGRKHQTVMHAIKQVEYHYMHHVKAIEELAI